MNRVTMLAILLLFSFAASQADAQSGETKKGKGASKEQQASTKSKGATHRGPVSEKSKMQFLLDFGRIPNALWSTTDYYDKVFFTDSKGQKMTAFYGSNGKLVATSFPKVFTDLPIRSQGIIKSTYKDYDIVSVYFIDYKAPKGGVRYYGRLLQTDNYFVALDGGGAGKVLLRVDLKGSVFFYKKL